MDSNSAAKLNKVHPDLARRVTAAIESLEPRDVRVVQGLRTYAEQDALYAQGRSKPGDRVTNARGGFSNHNFGLAADLCPFKDGKPQWNDESGFAAIGVAAKAQGLDWGGDWKKFKDRPHVELKHGLSLAQCRTLFNSGGLQAVWQKIAPSAHPQEATESGEVGDPRSFYKVVAGDYLTRIANSFHTTVEEIKRLNGLKSDTIHPGQTLRIK